jgi:hypothetical protein
MVKITHKSYEMAKSLKDDDAKLKGLTLITMPASFRIRPLRFMKSIGGIFVFKNLLKVKYQWHSFRYRYNEMLMNDCLCNEIRTKLQDKAAYHEQKAVSLLIKI